MCVGVNNTNGNNMNITFYRNDTQNETFYVVNRLKNVTNGTYCFCIDGHVDDIYYPVRFNETYHWYVNITDVVTGEYNVSDMYYFRTATSEEDCPCNETFVDTDTDTISDETWLIGLIIIFMMLPLSIIYQRRRR